MAAAQIPVLPKSSKSPIPIFGPLVGIIMGFLPKKSSSVGTGPKVTAQAQVAPTPVTVDSKPPSGSGAIAPVLPPGSGVKRPHVSLKVLGIVGVLILVLIFAIFPLVGMLFSRVPKAPGIDLTPTGSLTPTPTATPSGSIREDVLRDPSPYVDDAEVLKFSQRLDGIDKNMAGTVFREDALRVPLLDWDVKF